MVKVPELVQGILEYHRANRPGEEPPKHRIDGGTSLFDIAATYIGLDPQDSKNWKAIWQAVAAFVRANSTEEARADKTNGFVDENHIIAGKSLIIPEEVLGQVVANNTPQEMPEPEPFERPRQTIREKRREVVLANRDLYRKEEKKEEPEPLIKSGRSVDEVPADLRDPDPELEEIVLPTNTITLASDEITEVDPETVVAEQKADEIGDPIAVAAREEFAKANPDAAADLGIEIADEEEPPQVTRDEWMAALREDRLPDEWMDLDLSWQEVPVVGRDPDTFEDATFNGAKRAHDKIIQAANDRVRNGRLRNPLNPYGEGTYFNPIEKPAPKATKPSVASITDEG